MAEGPNCNSFLLLIKYIKGKNMSDNEIDYGKYGECITPKEARAFSEGMENKANKTVKQVLDELKASLN